ncbi:hypothetical protein Efla_004137 [Eimeria flavescens]
MRYSAASIVLLFQELLLRAASAVLLLRLLPLPPRFALAAVGAAAAFAAAAAAAVFLCVWLPLLAHACFVSSCRLLYGDGLQADCWAALGLYKQAAAATAEQQAQQPLLPLLPLPSSARLSANSKTERREQHNAQRQQRDTVKAEMFLAQSALQEHPEAFFFLGEIRQQQAAAATEQATKNKLAAEALRLYGRAAEGGYHLAWLREAEMLDAQAQQRRPHPDGPAACQAAALAYKAAAEFGSSADTVRRALQLYYEKDVEGALLLNLAAAEEGVEVAQWNAAFLLQSGAAAIPAAAAAAAAAAAPAAQEDTLLHARQQQAKPHAGSPAGATEALPQQDAPQQQQQEQEEEKEEKQQQQLSVVYRQLNRAALQGNVQALREIALLHASGREGAVKDERLSLQILMRTLSLGDLHSLPPLSLALEKRASQTAGGTRLLQRAEEMLQYFLESGGPKEAPLGTPALEAFEGGRSGSSWLKGLWRAAACRAAIWRMRLRRRLQTGSRAF